MHFNGYVLAFVIALVPSFAGAAPSLYQERARELQLRNEQANVARVNQHYDAVERRFMLNLEAFAQKFGMQGEPRCTSRDSGGGWGSGYRQTCGNWLCINVVDNGGRSKADAMSVDIYRKYEMVSGCEVVLNSGEACSIGYIHSQKDGWMTGFGGTCIDGNGNARTLKVPFRNIKFPK